jgi:hypothetical protein
MSKGEMSADTVQTYIANPASKSYVPRRVREVVMPKVRMLEDIHHGPRQAKLNGAYISRDWSKVAPGDWYQADDCTLRVASASVREAKKSRRPAVAVTKSQANVAAGRFGRGRTYAGQPGGSWSSSVGFSDCG